MQPCSHARPTCSLAPITWSLHRRPSSSLHLPCKEDVVPFLSSLLPGFKEAFQRREEKAALNDTLATTSRPGEQLFTSRFGGGGGLGESRHPSRSVRKVLRASDVYLWAVAAGSWDLALTLWRRTKNPVRCGLLAYHMCNVMASR
jgi:hypothetical protein